MKTGRTILFIGVQVAVAALAFVAGWNNGLPADRERLRSLEAGVEQMRQSDRSENNLRIETLQSVVEMLQVNGDTTGAVTRLNGAIDSGIDRQNGWMEFGESRGLEWPSGEDQFRLLLRVGEYRRTHPVGYSYPGFIRTPAILADAEKCRERRTSHPQWTPPKTTDVIEIQMSEQGGGHVR
jgi:hypothetical protein